MKDIDVLMREHFKTAEKCPPDGTWDEIVDRMSASSGPASGGRRRATWLVASAVALFAIGAVAVLVRIGGSDEIQHAAPHQAENETAHVTHESTVQKNIDATLEVDEIRAVANPDIEDAATGSEVHSAVAEMGSGNMSGANLSKASVPLAEITPDPPSPHPQSSLSVATLHQQEPDNTVEQDAPDETKPIETEREEAGEAPVAAHEEDAETIVIPNLITPNGDGYNDCWVIPDLEKYGQMRVQIYTAQTRRVYSSQDYGNDFCFDELPDGNYFYIIVFKELNRTLRGVLVVKR